MKLDFVEVAGFRGLSRQGPVRLPARICCVYWTQRRGKSTVLDAVDFALTGTINKFPVKTARGGAPPFRSITATRCRGQQVLKNAWGRLYFGVPGLKTGWKCAVTEQAGDGS
jgi:hypothetical protein